MYTGGLADPTARRFARLWAAVFGLGLPRAAGRTSKTGYRAATHPVAFRAPSIGTRYHRAVWA